MIQPRMLTGDRPTGQLHLGHYVGTLKNRIRYQHNYRSFFLVADLHMLTTRHRSEDIQGTFENARHLVLDALAAGIEPAVVTFYLQSAVHEIHEMYTLLQNMVTVARLERVPSLKEMARAADVEMSYGLLGYPVLQAADILCVRANLVPVGKDNLAHVEIAREIARRFNSTYSLVFPIPESVVGDVPMLVGTDGREKMSKSLHNAIFLTDSPDVVIRKVMDMVTDPNRIRADVPGTVEGNPIFIYHDAFNPNLVEVEDLKMRYRAGRVGDVEVKQKLALALNNMLDPIRERRSLYETPGLVEQILYEGTEKVRAEVKQTLFAMQQAMGLTGVWNHIEQKANLHSAFFGG